MPAAIAARAQGLSGGPDTALRMKASYFFDAMASWQLASSRCTSLLESNVVTVALLALPVSLALLMITCSTGLAWMATKWAMLTCLLALPALALLEVPDEEPPDESLPPHATTPTIAVASTAPTMTRLIVSPPPVRIAHRCAQPDPRGTYPSPPDSSRNLTSMGVSSRRPAIGRRPRAAPCR